MRIVKEFPKRDKKDESSKIALQCIDEMFVAYFMTTCCCEKNQKFFALIIDFPLKSCWLLLEGISS